MTEPTTVRGEPRRMLALIALAAELPMPPSIRFHPNGEILSLDFDRVQDGQAWSRFLGGKARTYTSDGNWYLAEGVIQWHGWDVLLHACEPVAPDSPLDDDTAARLAELVDAEAVSR